MCVCACVRVCVCACVCVCRHRLLQLWAPEMRSEELTASLPQEKRDMLVRPSTFRPIPSCLVCSPLPPLPYLLQPPPPAAAVACCIRCGKHRTAVFPTRMHQRSDLAPSRTRTRTRFMLTNATRTHAQGERGEAQGDVLKVRVLRIGERGEAGGDPAARVLRPGRARHGL